MTRINAQTALVIGLICASPSYAMTTAAGVPGTWQTGIGDQMAPDGRTAYLRATTVFTEEAQDLIFETFTDPDFPMPLFRYQSSGTWDPQGRSEAIPDALAANMTNNFNNV